MKKLDHTLFGTAIATTLATASMAFAADNPFAASELKGGYLQVAQAEGETKSKEGSCGEGKCAGMKMSEGKEVPKSKEMSCGEGKCGAGMMDKHVSTPAEPAQTAPAETPKAE